MLGRAAGILGAQDLALVLGVWSVRVVNDPSSREASFKADRPRTAHARRL